MSNKLFGVLVVFDLAALALLCVIACHQSNCPDACAEAVDAVLTAKHEKYQPAMGAEHELPKVNTEALFEKKGQCVGGQCPVPQSDEAELLARQYGAEIRRYEQGGYYAALPEGQVWESSGQRGTFPAPDTASLARQMGRGIRPFRKPYQPQPKQPTPNPNPPTDIKPGDLPAHQLERGRVLLFLDGSAESQKLRSWFDSDPDLAQLKGDCDFVEYREADLLYRSLFAAQITPEEFPAIIVADELGAILYNAMRDEIPGSEGELFAAIQQGASYTDQAKSSSGTAGRPDCVGPDCQLPPSPQVDKHPRRDGGMVERLKNKAQDKGGPLGDVVHSLFWGWLDDVILLIAIILAFILINKHLNNQKQQGE